jgi:hypothetical protein
MSALFAAGIAAALALPLWEFTQLSTRAQLSTSEQAVLSLPAGHLFGLILPDVGGYAEWLVYGGVVVLVLAVAAIISARPGWGIWGGVAVVSLLLSLGDHTPLYSFLSAIPGLNLLRVPPRWLFIFGFSLSILAGKGFDALLDEELPTKARRRVRLYVVAMGAFQLLLLVGVAVIGSRNPDVPSGSWVLASGIGVLAVILALAGLADRLKPWALPVGLLTLMVIDLGFVNGSLIEMRPMESAFERPEYLDEEELHEGRIFSPSYSVPQHIAVREGLQLADGVNPLQIASYRDFMASATGFTADAYSVTLPPFPGGDPGEDWSPVIDPSQLGLLNVSWIVSAYALDADGLDLDRVVDGEYLYRNQDGRPRAWVEPHEGGDSSWQEASVVAWKPNRITLVANGPGRLVLSEVDYPGWQAYLDGDGIEINAAYGVLRSVEVPAGEHEIIFRFYAWNAYFGAGITLLTLVGLAVLRWHR